MGVDYSGNYGIGVQIVEPDEENYPNDLDDPCMDEYVDWIVSQLKTECYYFSIGDQCYSGKTNDYYIVIDQPFIDGKFQQQKTDQLIKELKALNVEYYGNIDCVGGINIH